MDTLLDPAGGNQAGSQSGDTGNTAGQQGDGGQAQREWMKDLPESLRSAKTLTKFTDQEWKANLAKSYVELEGKLGKSVAVPAQDAAQEDWDRFYEKVGRPKSADDYAIEKGTMPDEFVKAFKAMAHESGLTTQQANALFKKFSGTQQQQQQAALEQMTAKMKATDVLLRKEYGAQYDTKLADAKKAFGKLFDDSLKAELTNAGLANDSRFIKVLAELGGQLRDDAFIPGVGTIREKEDPLAWMDKKYGAR